MPPRPPLVTRVVPCCDLSPAHPLLAALIVVSSVGAATSRSTAPRRSSAVTGGRANFAFRPWAKARRRGPGDARQLQVPRSFFARCTTTPAFRRHDWRWCPPLIHRGAGRWHSAGMSAVGRRRTALLVAVVDSFLHALVVPIRFSATWGLTEAMYWVPPRSRSSAAKNRQPGGAGRWPRGAPVVTLAPPFVLRDLHERAHAATGADRSMLRWRIAAPGPVAGVACRSRAGRRRGW